MKTLGLGIVAALSLGALAFVGSLGTRARLVTLRAGQIYLWTIEIEPPLPADEIENFQSQFLSSVLGASVESYTRGNERDVMVLRFPQVENNKVDVPETIMQLGDKSLRVVAIEEAA